MPFIDQEAVDMKKLLLLIVIAGIAMFALLGRGRKNDARVPATSGDTVAATWQPDQPKQINAEPRLMKAIAEAVDSGNKQLPMMVDPYTRLDKMTAGPGTQLTYLYTLPDSMSYDVNRKWITTDVKPKVTKGVCAEKDMRKLLKLGATLVFAYKGKDDVAINHFQIREGDCQVIKPA